jgi:hypothetical protein
MHTHQRSPQPAATIGLDIGKITFHLVGLDKRAAAARPCRPSPGAEVVAKGIARLTRVRL